MCVFVCLCLRMRAAWVYVHVFVCTCKCKFNVSVQMCARMHFQCVCGCVQMGVWTGVQLAVNVIVFAKVCVRSFACANGGSLNVGVGAKVYFRFRVCLRKNSRRIKSLTSHLFSVFRARSFFRNNFRRRFGSDDVDVGCDAVITSDVEPLTSQH